MASRGGKTAGKVSKSASGSRRGSRQSSLLLSAREQLQGVVQTQADNNASELRISVSPEPSETSGGEDGHAQHSNAFTAVNAPAAGNAPAAAHDSVESVLLRHALDEGYHNHSQQEQQQLQQMNLNESTQTQQASFPGAQDQQPVTGEHVVIAAYGNAVKIDSALCKKLASEPALRDPIQRRADQKLNIERRSNVEALLAHVTGEEAPKACKNCHKGHGPWTTCVVYDGQMCGSCSNCWFNASGSRCTFHENNNPQPQAQYQRQQSPSGPAPAAARQPHQEQEQQQQQQQPASAMTYQLHQSAVAPAPPAPSAPPAPLMPPAQIQAAAANYANSITLSQLHGSDIAQWRMADAARRAVNRGWEGMGNISRRQRYIARIEAAAKELGMRIAEYDEYMRSPEGIDEGIAEERAAQELRDAEARAQAQAQQEQADAS
ncbi:Uncharacterized protein TCAP_06287 [Tolypocladium capitatum]|uniref:Uncharacterized protein n=1 Tax=Tolypocladium capitatum TaxID=45235 RepID=A0A2K3Q881_9HYPO|nr:Uncharacterized protein TCAP_06287 [Tolypocladium capitatum]